MDNGYGITLYESENSKIFNNTISRNTVGVYIDGSSNIDVSGNNFTDNTKENVDITGDTTLLTIATITVIAVLILVVLILIYIRFREKKKIGAP